MTPYAKAFGIQVKIQNDEDLSKGSFKECACVGGGCFPVEKRKRHQRPWAGPTGNMSLM